jgi:hypothetical protein
VTVFDTEADSLYPTKFHVLSYKDKDKTVSLTTHDEMRGWLLEQDVLVGHNISMWDVPQLERVLNIKVKARLIDTLALSWYLFPDVRAPGLEYWGEYFNVPKPPIKDWKHLDIKDYIHRCETDVKINTLLWEKEQDYLNRLYEDCNPILDYLMFKMDCAREQEANGWKLDIKTCQANLEKLESIALEKANELIAVMPPVKKYAIKTRPKKSFNKDGTWSVLGAKWFKLLLDNGLPNDYMGEIKIEVGEETPNPASHVQIKEWLFSLGWEPDYFKEDKQEDGSIRQIPQIKKEKGNDLTDSVVALIDEHPQVAALEGYGVVNHRISILKGFLRDCGEDGRLKARIHGLTNTLRFKHTEIVNLPGVSSLYGEEIRGCLIADPDKELCGTDMVSIEDSTKRHYIYPYDPAYVEEMSAPDFDPHLDVAFNAGFITKEQIEEHKQLSNEGKKSPFKKLRDQFKVVNYSAIYGVGAPKLSRQLRISVADAKALLDAYWKRNWAVKELVKPLPVKTVYGQMWLYNPVSKFWYSLRFDKDKFSTLNQGTATYCFDRWVMEIRKKRPQLTAQFHDEIVQEIKKGFRKEHEKLLHDSINIVNNQIRLNVILKVKPMFGDCYADIH